MRSVPTDTRPIYSASKQPPPISGGTLLVTADNKYAIAADPDRDRVSIVDLETRAVSWTIPLAPGDEPGRLAEDASGLVYVVLRRGGAVVSIDPKSQTIVSRRKVCATPRGIAYDQSADVLRVACQSGELWTLPTAVGEALAPWSLAIDLRDVVVQGDKLFVTQLKSAEVLQLDHSGAIVTRSTPLELQITDMDPSGGPPATSTAKPEAARRTIGLADGGMLMLYQAAREDPITLSHDPSTPPTIVSAYGGGSASASDCQGVVRTMIAKFDANGQVVDETQIPAVVAVDLAYLEGDSVRSPSLAVAVAGAIEAGQQLPSLVFPNGPTPTALGVSAPPGPPILVFDNPLASTVAQGACMFGSVPDGGENTQITAVAYDRNGTLLAQSRQPAALMISSNTSGVTQIDLGGETAYDTGHEIFHRDAGGGIACASCHIEGAEDGHVWQFTTLGARRTQPLHVGLAGTAPFHWGGDMPSISAIMQDVFVTRMGGAEESPSRVTALESWLYALTPPSPIRASDDEAALRGKALFEGEAACSSCHAGEKFTNNATVDVGKGVALQVPSLRGVAYRAPFLHDGCAPTLRDRFSPGCGGSSHGQTSQLTLTQIDDLIAYLETL